MWTAETAQGEPLTEGYCNGAEVRVLRRRGNALPDASRKFLVFVAASHQIIPSLGAPLSPDRNFDLAVRYYHPPHADDELLHAADYVLTGGLSKFHAAKLFIEQLELLPCYDGFLFLDGDISFAGRAMETLLETAHSEGFALAQAGLTADSYYSWEVTLARPAFRYRETSFVEVMAPYFSSRSLAATIHTFDQSISSHGLDRVWPHLLDGQRIGVIDAVTMRHSQPINRRHGAFYTYLKSIGIDEGKEQRELLMRYGVRKVRPHDLAGFRPASDDPAKLERIPLIRLPYPLIRYSHYLDGVQAGFSRFVGTARKKGGRISPMQPADHDPGLENTGQ